MKSAPKGWPRWATGPLPIIIVSGLMFYGIALLGDHSRGTKCPKQLISQKKEQRYVSIFTKESKEIRWKLPAVVRVCVYQDESCAMTEHRHIDAVYWQDGGHTDFKDCLLVGNFIGDCVDDQGRTWRAKIFAKATDEIPSAHSYPESSNPKMRVQR